MIEKLRDVVKRYEELNALLSDPAVISDSSRFRDYAKEHAELGPVVTAFQEWERVDRELAGSKEILAETKDAELRELAQAEVAELEEKKDRLHQELVIQLLPKDPSDDKNI